MTATLVSRSAHTTVVEFAREFEWADCPGAGFGFPCDAEGNLLNDNPASQANFAMCLTGAGEDGAVILDHGIRRSERTVWDPAVYRCECGGTIHGDGDNRCACGRWYNAGGQELDPHAMECSLYAQGIDCMCGEGDE